MSALEIFTYSSDQPVRTVLVDGEPWFVAADVLQILALNRSSIALLDDDERGVHTVDTLGGAQSVGIINESGLYSLILRSRKAEAKVFKRWVTHEVLPQIRRTGQFGSQIPGSFAEALELAAAKQRQIEAAEAELEAARPKVEAYDALMDADGYYSMAAVARMVGLGRNTLFSRLRDLGILQRGSNLPYRQYDHHFAVTTSTHLRDGIEHVSYTTRVRPTGLDYLRKRLDERVTA